MKFLQKALDNSLFIFTIFLVAFIPLYPKLPLLGVSGTWVYIRLEDVFLAIAGVLFVIQVFRRKAVLKTPLSFPILAFWIVGAISTISAVIFIFPHIAAVSPKIAFFNYARRIEYLLPFFLALSAIHQKKNLKPLIITILITVTLVCLYGFGQKIDPSHFFAFSTMNEEFAKGIPLQLSAAARIPSTFAGHYDLAAFLVLMIPLIGSLVFGVKKLWYKIGLILLAIASLCLLLLTESRISFAVYLVAMALMLLIQKQKKLIIPVIIASILIAVPFQGIIKRFTSTITSVDQVVDARTGKVVGIANSADQTGEDKLVIKDTLSTGENLPQGSGYINVPGSATGTSSNVTIITSQLGKTVTENLKGDFVVKKGYAYDVSFTTRFQGEWPRAVEAFKRNILLGSGYSSISLATDGNYLRILGEVGLGGFITFFTIFLVYVLFAYRVLPDIDSPIAKSYVLGVMAGIFGLMLNAIFIDVFEASKVAYTLWFLVGSGTAVLSLYQKQPFHTWKEIKDAYLSPVGLALLLLMLVIGVWSRITGNFFVGDDFTWLRWSADCPQAVIHGLSQCQPLKDTFLHYFVSADGFFYRPGAKILFSILFALGSLSSFAYHVATLVFHIATSVSLFALIYVMTKRKWFAIGIATAFVVASGYHESLFWISSMGHVISSYCIVGGLLYYLLWREKKNVLFLLISLLHVFAAPLFQELGIVAPIVILMYEVIIVRKIRLKEWWILGLYLIQIPLYITIRTIANSHWSGGDYSYNLMKLPFNVVGNTLGALALGIFGVPSMNLYNSLRLFLRQDLLLAGLFGLAVLLIGGVLVITLWRKTPAEIRKYFLFFFLLFLVPLLPFLGLGNLTERYTYLATVGVVGMGGTLLLWLFEAKKKPTWVIGLSVIILGVYGGYHLLQINELQSQWHTAGEITETTIAGTTEVYTKEGKIANSVYIFVNTPVKYKSAWVFPVGLPDAVWLALQNEPITAKQAASLPDAFSQAKLTPNSRVILFDKNYQLVEVASQ
jgi:hypothetical protein